MAKSRFLATVDIPLEVAVLVVGALTLLLTGMLLFPIAAGDLGYFEGGLYGLLLVIFGVEIITLGKTPFGDLRRSKGVVAAGALIAAVGIVTCFVPDLLGNVPRILLFVCFGPGGLALIVQMALDKTKARTWWASGGILRHVVFASASVYLLSMVVAALLWLDEMLTASATAVVILIFAVAVFYLAGVLQVVYRRYPVTQEQYRDGDLSADVALLLLIGLFLVLLGALLVPISLGSLPSSGSAQLGLLMVIFAVQMLASGTTPLGPFPRSPVIIVFGLIFAAIGIVACIIPDVFLTPLTLIIGVINIAGGAITLMKVAGQLGKPAEPQESRSPILLQLIVVQALMGLLAITFGVSMLVAGLIPGAIVGAVLVANGCVLLFELRLLFLIQRQQAAISQ